MKKQDKVSRAELERFYRKCPVVLKPRAAARWMPISVNYIYDAIRKKELRAFVYRGGYVISKEDMIDYILEHCADPAPWAVLRKGDEE